MNVATPSEFTCEEIRAEVMCDEEKVLAARVRSITPHARNGAKPINCDAVVELAALKLNKVTMHLPVLAIGYRDRRACSYSISGLREIARERERERERRRAPATSGLHREL